MCLKVGDEQTSSTNIASNYDPSEEFLGGMNQRLVAEEPYEVDRKPILIPNPITGFKEASYQPLDGSTHVRLQNYVPSNVFQGQFIQSSTDPRSVVQVPGYNEPLPDQYPSGSGGGSYGLFTGPAVVKREEADTPPYQADSILYPDIADDLNVSDSDEGEDHQNVTWSLIIIVQEMYSFL